MTKVFALALGLAAVSAWSQAKAENKSVFEEIDFGKTLIIEGRVEKPQVQFPLLKEQPPEKEIRFETSFKENILKQERENTFRPETVEGGKK